MASCPSELDERIGRQAMDIARSAGEPGQPAKIVLQMRARAGQQQELETWIRELLRVAARSSALQGASVLTGGRGDYFVLLRFAGMTELNKWESTPAVRALLHRGEAFAVGMEESIARTGLETWFELPGVPSAVRVPPRWKMAVVTWAALMPQVGLLRLIAPRSWPFLLTVAVTTAIPVAMLTWVVMPWLSKLLRGWLYAAGRVTPENRERSIA